MLAAGLGQSEDGATEVLVAHDPMIDAPESIRRRLEHDRLFRSPILNEGIAAEIVLNQVIAWYFCPDESKHDALLSFVFRDGGIMLGRKIDILQNLLRYAYPDLKEPFDYLPKRLHSLRTLRNKVAHCPSVDSLGLPAATAESITLRELKKGKMVDTIITTTEVDACVAEAKYLQLALILLLFIVKGRVSGTRVNEESLIENAMEVRKELEAAPRSALRSRKGVADEREAE